MRDLEAPASRRPRTPTPRTPGPPFGRDPAGQNGAQRRIRGPGRDGTARGRSASRVPRRHRRAPLLLGCGAPRHVSRGATRSRLLAARGGGSRPGCRAPGGRTAHRGRAPARARPIPGAPDPGAAAAALRTNLERRDQVVDTYPDGGFGGALAACFVFDSTAGTFGVRNLAIGGGLSVAGILWLTILSFSRSLVRRRTFSTKGGDLGSLPFAPFARWRQLPEGSPLVRHQENDPLCPCFQASCGGSLVGPAVSLRWLDIAARYLILLVGFILMGYTAMVTFGPQTWTTGWSAFFAAIIGRCMASRCSNLVPEELLKPSRQLGILSCLRSQSQVATSPPYASACGSIAAASGWRSPPSSPCNCYESAIFNGVSVDAGTEPYEDLCERLDVLWRNRFPSRSATPHVLRNYLLMPFTIAIVVMISGSCIPAWLFFQFSYGLLLVFTDLVNFASSNSQVSAASSLLRRAARESQQLLARASALGLSQTPAAAALARHAEVMLSYAAADGCEARFAGFVVRYDTARTCAITLFTLGVGLWSVLRGAGVSVVLDVPCPA
ncbi:hypothetical protein DFJ74DRAFT_685534 [Hyaloraphidium curvatum]|nr:hypothetical protein DFJ74DRAFT_685534 [Hyaloraphidium curvatum]